MRHVLNHRKHFSVSVIFKMSHFFCSWVYLVFLMVLIPLLVSINAGTWRLKEGVSSPILPFFIEVENAYFLLVQEWCLKRCQVDQALPLNFHGQSILPNWY